jgi:hypothetical protein
MLAKPYINHILGLGGVDGDCHVEQAIKAWFWRGMGMFLERLETGAESQDSWE